MGLFEASNMLTLVLVTTLGLVCGSMLPTSQADMVLDALHTHTTAFMYPTPEPNATEDRLHSSNNGGDSNPIVPDEPIILDYHHGPIMTGKNEMIRLNVVFYGTFSNKQKATLRLFFRSFWNNAVELEQNGYWPTAAKWWQITRRYVDLHKTPIARSIVPGGEMQDWYSQGKNLRQSNIQAIVNKAMKQKDIGCDARDMYLVLTSDDVLVEKFCMSMCGTHYYLFPSQTENAQMVPYGWVGNPGKQCPGLCSWPYAPGGFVKQALIPPNGDVGIDGMIITIANIIASMATNPYDSGYYQEGSHLETAAVCQGMFGTGSFSGYPGELLVDKATKASFNVYGASNAKFLLPWIWNPVTKQCAGQV
ncbi:hypothetical protein MPTK1_4g02840 [Marchantia polymorpha subsp. ruderalis]|uniref:Uncharacterized protein n=2 Tax=Marchantia polymorpha TaxID=3197 RepID=A0AAF6B5N0_MARPO|nr:hypothetical protein MARPO_0080s0015 [Marchantia polymorpha]BBN07314.1 hypothetical protein Mp_4g02840 [Marchantia polymorpha subsp. ruderalis]|eukprot:PTQ34390.1 hypothetical protein MARPO_0080s0015 [Marchantia polymorpha]